MERVTEVKHFDDFISVRRSNSVSKSFFFGF